MGILVKATKKTEEPLHLDLIQKFGQELPMHLNNIDAKELSWGSPKTLYKRDKLSYKIFSNPKLKFYKVYFNDKIHANFCIGEMDPTARKLGATYIGIEEYLKITEGEEFVQALKSEMKDYKRAKGREELRLVRRVKEIETKLLEKNQSYNFNTAIENNKSLIIAKG